MQFCFFWIMHTMTAVLLLHMQKRLPITLKWGLHACPDSLSGSLVFFLSINHKIMSNTQTHFSHVKTYIPFPRPSLNYPTAGTRSDQSTYQVKWVTMSSAIQVTNTKCTWMFIVQYICIHLKDSPLFMTILFSHKVNNYMQTHWLDSQKCFQKLVMIEFHKETFRSPAHIQVTY